MNKKYKQFLTSLNMTVNGNSAYGVVKGWETNFSLVSLDYRYSARLHISFYATDEQKRAISNELRKAKIKCSGFELTQFGLLILMRDLTTSKILKLLDEVLNDVFAILSANEAVGAGCCPVCGEPASQENARPYNTEFGRIIMDDECAKDLNDLIAEENKDFKEAPNNYIRGFFGALIGGVVGAFITIILYYVGFVASLSAVVAVALGAFLYAKFGGKQNVMMIVIVSLTTLAFIVLSIFGIYIHASGVAAREEGIMISGIDAFRILMTNDDFKTLFFRDMGMVVGFTIFGIIIEAITISKKIKRKKQMNSVY